MEKLEKVELIRQKTGVSYDDANAALEASNGDVLDAIIFLERVGKAQPQTASYTTSSADTTFGAPVSPQMAEAQSAYQESSRKSKFAEKMEGIFAYVKRLLKKGFDVTFVVDRKGSRIIAIPAIILLIGLLAWGAAIPLLIVGLFFDCRYHFEGMGTVTVDVNDVMSKAGDMAESIKQDVTGANDGNANGSE